MLEKVLRLCNAERFLPEGDRSIEAMKKAILHYRSLEYRIATSPYGFYLEGERIAGYVFPAQRCVDYRSATVYTTEACAKLAIKRLKLKDCYVSENIK